jgi:xanthine/CO dehydrogenase XdhC/CoxF family maturation factor
MVRQDGYSRGDLTDDDLSARVIRSAREALQYRRSAVAAFDGEGGTAEALIEHIAPPVSLLVFGAGSDAKPVVRLAKEIGWDVTVIDNRPAYARSEHFPEADEVRLLDYERLDEAELEMGEGGAAVIMTHHFLRDLALLKFLLPTPLSYIGLLGPRKRTDNLLVELGRQAAAPTGERLAVLHGPVGIDIGSETPEEIALAILAEIQAVLAGRPAGFLKNRRQPLHDWPA